MNIGTPWDGAPREAQGPDPQTSAEDVAELAVSISGEGGSACTGETTEARGYRGLGQGTWLEKWLGPRNLRACSQGLQNPRSPPPRPIPPQPPRLRLPDDDPPGPATASHGPFPLLPAYSPKLATVPP